MQIMTKFIESSKHNKYIISSNKLTQLKDFCEAAMNELEISFEVDYQKDKLVFIDVLTGQPIFNSDEKIHRKIDLNGIKGDNSLIKNSYGWEPKKDINFIIQKMIKFKLKNY